MDARDDTPEDIRELKHQNNERLRNAFEEIITKYSHDFSDVGDEIDITTGEIIVNKGHISRMRDEQDTGLRAESVFFQDWANEVREEEYGEIGPEQNSSRTLASEDVWEDVEDEGDAGRDQHEQGDHIQKLRSLLVDELAGENAALGEAGRGSPRLSPLPEKANAPPKRHNSLAEQNEQPAEMTELQPLFDPQVIHTFAETLANQITNFAMQMAMSMSQQLLDPSRNNQATLPTPRPFSDVYNTPAKRRKVSHGDEDSDLGPGRGNGGSQNRLLKSQLDRLTGQTGHGHRGKTPGMPSLWSGDDSDDLPKARKKVAGSVGKNSRTGSAVGSSLRHEVSSNLGNQHFAALDAVISTDDEATISAASNDELYVQPQTQHPGHGSLHLEDVSVVTRKKKSALHKSSGRDDTMQPKKKYHQRRSKPFTTKDDSKMIGLYYSGLGYKAIAAHFNATENQVRYHFTERLIVAGDNFQPRPGIFTPPESPSRENTPLGSTDIGDRQQIPFTRDDQIARRQPATAVQDFGDDNTSVMARRMSGQLAKPKSRAKSVAFANEVEVRSTTSPAEEEPDGRFRKSARFDTLPVNSALVQQPTTALIPDGSYGAYYSPLPYYNSTSPSVPLHQLLNAMNRSGGQTE